MAFKRGMVEGSRLQSKLWGELPALVCSCHAIGRGSTHKSGIHSGCDWKSVGAVGAEAYIYSSAHVSNVKWGFFCPITKLAGPSSIATWGETRELLLGSRETILKYCMLFFDWASGRACKGLESPRRTAPQPKLKYDHLLTFTTLSNLPPSEPRANI